MNKKLLSLLLVTLIVASIYLFQIFYTNKPAEEVTGREETSFEVIGQSVQGYDIEVHTFGIGAKHLLFVGGIHGGYEGNTVLLAEEFISYFKTNPEKIPSEVMVSIIPVLNPDGLDKPTDINPVGRFNGNGVDLNRNFDCKWESTSTWKNQTVSAGDLPFSEPETAALRDFILTNAPEAVVFWHSQANAVYASECEAGVLQETKDLLGIYTAASGYPGQLVFDDYEVTGDAEGWLASIGIPALSVELSTHEVIEWDKNLSGVTALLTYYASSI